MKLAEYMEILGSLSHEFNTEAAIQGACIDGTNEKEYQDVMKSFQRILMKNRDVLDIGHLGSMSAEEQEVMEESEIDPDKLRLHIAMVRHDLMHAIEKDPGDKKDEIAYGFLNDLSARTGTAALGNPGSALEEQLVQEARKPKPRATNPDTPRKAKAEARPLPEYRQPKKSRQPTELEAINALLREKGILK